jgi:mono/diheme cytochrome c family protein
MDARIRLRILTALGGVVILAAAPATAAAQAAGARPQGVTPDMVAKGKKVFSGAGLCLACHGPDGKGTIGPNLTDKEWLHVDGSFEQIVKLVLAGVDQAASKTGQIMPPKGGSSINEADARAVAAYVWTLSQKK